MSEQTVRDYLNSKAELESMAVKFEREKNAAEDELSAASQRVIDADTALREFLRSQQGAVLVRDTNEVVVMIGSEIYRLPVVLSMNST